MLLFFFFLPCPLFVAAASAVPGASKLAGIFKGCVITLPIFALERANWAHSNGENLLIMLITKTITNSENNGFEMTNHQRVYDLVDAGKGRDEIMSILGCSKTTFYRIQADKKKGRTIQEVLQRSGGRPQSSITPTNRRRLRDAVRRQPR